MTKKRPAVGTPEFMAMIRAKRGKGKRKTPSWKKDMSNQLKAMGKLVTKMAKKQGVAVPGIAKRAVKKTTRKTVKKRK